MILLILFLEFFKVGLFTFGGGYAMIPLIKELVLKYDWLTESQFYDFIGICESTPGPIAVNMATYVGSTQAGLIGSIFATIGVVLPSFIIIILIASVLNKLTKNKYFKRAFKGITPVIIGLIVSAGLIILFKSFGWQSFNNWKSNLDMCFIFLFLITTYYGIQIFFKKKIPIVVLIFISGLMGILLTL